VIQGEVKLYIRLVYTYIYIYVIIVWVILITNSFQETNLSGQIDEIDIIARYLANTNRRTTNNYSLLLQYSNQVHIIYLLHIFFAKPPLHISVCYTPSSRRTSYNSSKLMIVIFINFMNKFFILIYLLHSSTYLKHYYAHIQEDNFISAASGIVTLETSEWSKLHLNHSLVPRMTISFAVIIQLPS